MYYLQLNNPTIGIQEFPLVDKATDDIYIYKGNPYPTDGSLFLLDTNANVLDKNADSYPDGTIEAYGFQAGDGNYYAVRAKTVVNNPIGDNIESLSPITSLSEARKDYAGEKNTDKIIDELGTLSNNAAGVCRQCTLNGKPGFLPSLGQFYDFLEHFSEIESLITKFSLHKFVVASNHWTSTLASSASEFWTINYGPSRTTNTSESFFTKAYRPFFTL